MLKQISGAVTLTIFLVALCFTPQAQSLTHYNSLPAIALNSTGQIGINITKSTTGPLSNYTLKVSFPQGLVYVPGGAQESNTPSSGGATVTNCTETDISDLSSPVLSIPTVYGSANSPTHIVFNVSADCSYQGQAIAYTLYDNTGKVVSGPFNDVPNSISNKASVIASGAVIAPGQTATLTASSTISAGAIYTWYTDAALSSVAGTGSSFTTPALSSNKDYYVTVSGPSYCEGTPTKVTVITQRASAADIIAANATVCPGTATTLNAKSTTITGSGVVFKWYADAALTQLLNTDTSFSPPALSTNTTYYVTVQSSSVGENAPGTAKQVNVSISNVCGSLVPAGCSASGTLLSLETFGDAGTKTQTAGPKPSGLITSYTKATGTYTFKPDADQYAITNSSGTNGYAAWWNNVTDHTSCVGTAGTTCGTGYMMEVNVDKTIKSIYQKTMTGLCPGTKLFFSAWVLSLVQNSTGYYPPNITFVLTDESGNVIGSLATGNIANADKNWKQYGFNFTIPDNTSSVTLNIMNNQPQVVGNDLAIDDIGIYACTPPVSVSGLTSPYCQGATMSLTTNYTDDGSLGTPLYHQWYYSATGELDSWNSWSKIGQPSSSNVLNNPTPVTGYYRVVVGTLANINAGKVYCCAVSNEIYVEVVAGQQVTPISGDSTLCPNSTLALSNTTTGGTWESTNPSIATVNNSGLVTGLTSGSSDIRYTVNSTANCATTVVKTILVKPLAAASDISVRNASTTVGQTVTLNAVSTTVANPVFNWYTDASMTQLLYTGPSFTTPIIKKETSYFVTVSSDSICANAGAGKIVLVSISKILPILFTSFTVGQQNNQIMLKWQVTADEKSGNFFVQYSTDGRVFSNLANIAYIDNKTTYSYLYTPNSSGKYYFRIAASDVNGVQTYTDIKDISISNLDESTSLKLSPNPASGTIYVKLKASKQTNVQIRIFNTNGAEVVRYWQSVGSSEATIPIDIQSLSEGAYLLQANFDNQTRASKFVKLK